MALVIQGKVAALHPAAPNAVTPGRVWIGDDGLIAAVTAVNGAAPIGFSTAPIVDVGTAYVMPGFIDLHNHLGYNTLPLWTEATQTTAFKHHNSWTDADSYKEAISWPAWTLAKAAPEALLAYVQLRALVGGTTSIQGWPAANRQLLQILRNIDTEKAGTERDLIRTSALTKTPVQLAQIAQAESRGTGFIYHCAEGQPGTVVAQEFGDAAMAGCLRRTFIGVHCTSVEPAAWNQWSTPDAGAVVWSPFSNLWLYGRTTLIPAAIARGVTVCLGSDWGPSGTKNVLGELKVAKLASKTLGYDLTDDDLFAMVTANPGDILKRCWSRQIGRLVPGAFGDLVVLRSKRAGSLAKDAVAATEKEVALVVVGGKARYGDASLMTAAATMPTAPITVAGVRRRFSIADPSNPAKAWSWDGIKAAIDQVRQDPAGSLEHAEGVRRRFAGVITDEDAPFELVLDMPTGGLMASAGPPPDPSRVTIPKLPSLVHDAAFFRSIRGRGFHSGLLDGLAAFYE